MHLPQFEYVKAQSVAHAVTLLGERPGRAAILAGGTDLLASMAQRLSTPAVVIGIRDLAELREVTVTADGGLSIGAGATLATLTEHPVIAARFPALRAALRAVASRHVRNVATLGGNLALPTRCWYTNQAEGWRQARAGCYKTDREACHVLAASDHCVATSSADSAPALMVHGAVATLVSLRGSREVPLSEFYREDGAKPTVLEPDELITRIDVPPCTDRTAFLKVTPREGIDFGLGTLAVAVAGGNRRPTRVRIVANALGSRPLPLVQAEQIVLAQGLTPASIEAASGVARQDLGEVTNLWTPAGYKKRLVRVLLARALDEVRRQPAASRRERRAAEA